MLVASDRAGAANQSRVTPSGRTRKTELHGIIKAYAWYTVPVSIIY